MNRLVLCCALLGGACGSATDDRPATLEYITDTILAPSCAAAECHSAFTRQVGDQFDTVAATRQTIVADPLVVFDDRTDPAGSYLITVMTKGEPSRLSPGSGNVRMPYDAPIPDEDIALIEKWISNGFPGAQCVPNDQQLGCVVHTVFNSAGVASTEADVVKCSADGNAGDIVQVCAPTQTCSIATGNGKCV